jgi:hypothetical protein
MQGLASGRHNSFVKGISYFTGAVYVRRIVARNSGEQAQRWFMSSTATDKRRQDSVPDS